MDTSYRRHCRIVKGLDVKGLDFAATPSRGREASPYAVLRQVVRAAGM
jgi:hypothetical protein